MPKVERGGERALRILSGAADSIGSEPRERERERRGSWSLIDLEL